MKTRLTERSAGKMNRLFINIVTLCLFLIFFDGVSYSAENEKDALQVSAPKPVLPSRPILPPTVRTSISAISPTPSPHIASPPVAPIAIKTPPTPTPSTAEGHIPVLPSVPTHATMPYVPVTPELPQAQIMDSIMARVHNIGSEADGSLWIEVKEQLFNQIQKISVENLENISIIRGGSSVNFYDIKIGDMVNVIFRRQGEERIANFIRIITEEELEMMDDTDSNARKDF